MTAPLTKDQRTALVASLRSMPAAMRDLPQWLMWQYVVKDPAKKPAKMPYYANGNARGWPLGRPKGGGKPTAEQPQVAQGDELDRQHLVTFDQAVDALAKSPRWSGVGFAFLPGDGLIGVDIDNAITEDGEISERAQLWMQMCPGYTELSPSGRGMHIILKGVVESFKSDAIGLEVYCDHQYFTCTGARWGNGPDEPPTANMTALSAMRAMCERANDEERERRQAEKAAQAPAKPARAPSAPPQPRADGEKGDDFQVVNERALATLSAWVPVLLPSAKEWTTKFGPGYRVTSKDLGRDLQEDLALTPGGIMDWGTRVGMSAVDVVMQVKGLSAYEALQWLAPIVGVKLKRRGVSPASPSAQRPPPPPEEQAPSDEAPPGEDPRPDPGAANDEPPPSPHKKKPRRSNKGEGSDSEEKPSRINWENLAVLQSSFAFQYGSDIAWDRNRREAITISNLRNTFGSGTVRYWMEHPDRAMLFSEDVMFEPGLDLGEGKLNLYCGLEMEPEEGDASVMVELLRYLCSTSVAPGLGPEEIADWVLKWCAYPLQNIGAKLETACVFHGPHGTGKNLFFDCIRDLYGRYGIMVGQTEIEEKYNTWLSGKLFIVGDEVVSRQEMEHNKNRLKWVVSQKSKIPIRAMNRDTRWESNHAQLVFLSNESKPLALENGDRRFMVIYTPSAERGDLYARVSKFLDEGGAAKFLHYLKTIPLEGFNEHTKPPLTEAKATLIELGMKPAERFMHEWIGGFLPLPMNPCTTEQLYTCFRRWCDRTGERFPPRQADFTEQAKRYALERIERDADGKYLEPRFTYKVVTMPDTTKATGRKSVRCWIPRGCGPRELTDPDDADAPQFKTEGEWMKWCMDAFDKVVWGFMRSRAQEYEGDLDAA